MFKKIFVFLFMVLLAGCARQYHPVFWRGDTSPATETHKKAPTVAALLPLSGQSKSVGESLKNAALMSAFENRQTPVKVLFFDTEGTEGGAEQAYQWALAQRPDIVLGPVFSKEVAAVQKSGISVPLLTFSSDTSLMNYKTGTMAVTVPEQIRQMVRYACRNNQLRLGVLGPESKTGEISMNALAEEIQSCPGMNMAKISLYEADTMNFTKAVQDILPPIIDADKPNLSEKEKAELAKPMSERAGLDAIFVFEEGIKLRQLLSILAFYDAGPRDIPVYTFAVVGQINDNSVNGAYFADLDETNYRNFAQKYQTSFGRAPTRIASQMYDALSWIFSEVASGNSVSLSDLQQKSRYWGVDGLIHLNSDGTNRRALQLKQKRGSRSVLVEAAEDDFSSLSNANVGGFMGQEATLAY